MANSCQLIPGALWRVLYFDFLVSLGSGVLAWMTLVVWKLSSWVPIRRNPCLLNHSAYCNVASDKLNSPLSWFLVTSAVSWIPSLPRVRSSCVDALGDVEAVQLSSRQEEPLIAESIVMLPMAKSTHICLHSLWWVSYCDPFLSLGSEVLVWMAMGIQKMSIWVPISRNHLVLTHSAYCNVASGKINSHLSPFFVASVVLWFLSLPRVRSYGVIGHGNTKDVQLSPHPEEPSSADPQCVFYCCKWQNQLTFAPFFVTSVVLWSFSFPRIRSSGVNALRNVDVKLSPRQEERLSADPQYVFQGCQWRIQLT